MNQENKGKTVPLNTILYINTQKKYDFWLVSKILNTITTKGS